MKFKTIALTGGALLLAAAIHGAAAAAAAGQWTSYNNGLDGQRYSPLKQINRTNVGALRPICQVELGELGSFQSGLLVIGGTLYLTTPHSTLALDAASCALKWRRVHETTDREIHPSNRGPAYDQGRLFRGTPDGRLLALDAATGRPLWDVNLRAEGHPGEFDSAAPIVWQGRLLVGTSGGDWGSGTRMLAFDTHTGAQLWHFNLIPRDGEPGAETWGPVPEDKRRGASTWSSYALDTKTGEVFLTAGNPVPAMDAAARPGDNLYSNSLVVLDARTGKLRWYYQVLANDYHDWDLAAAPMLYRAGRDMVAMSSKDGHLYGIDRTSHTLAFKTPVTTVLNQDAPLTVEGVRACPGVYGGTLWNGPAFDPRGRKIYVGTADRCQLFKLHEPGSTSPMTMGFGTQAVISELPEDVAQGWLYAVDAVSGQPAWKYHNDAPITSAVTPTAGGLVFAGDVNGKFFALDASSGNPLYQFDSGAMLGGGIVSYQVGKRQYVAFANGGMVRAVYPTKAGVPKLTIATLADAATIPKLLKLDPLDTAPGTESHAIKLYAQLCALCHGDQGQGIDGPRLKGVASRKDTRPVAEIIRAPRYGMPAYVPGVLSEQDVEALAAFIENWK